MDPGMQIPDCVQRAIVHAFQPETGDIWMDSDELHIDSLFIVHEDEQWAWVLETDDLSDTDNLNPKFQNCWHINTVN